jgi:hypothetical protein
MRLTVVVGRVAARAQVSRPFRSRWSCIAWRSGWPLQGGGVPAKNGIFEPLFSDHFAKTGSGQP